MALNACTKYSYHVLNTFLLIAGIVELVSALIWIIWMLEYKLFLSINIFIPIIVLIFSQLLLILLYWIGFTAIRKENKTRIIILCVLFLTKTLMEIVIGVGIFIIRDATGDIIKTNMEKSFEKYLINGHYKDKWNRIEYTLSCCGIDGIKSYTESKIDFIPVSCCNSTLNVSVCNGGFYQNGCHDALSEYIRGLLLLLGQIVFLFLGIQIIGMSIFCRLDTKIIKSEMLLINSVKKQNRLIGDKCINT